MFSFSIVESELRGFMNKLLREEVFDFFEARGADIMTFARFEIDGRAEKDPDGGAGYCTWGELRPYVFGIIKGRRPRAFKIVLSLPGERALALHGGAAAFFLNLSFDGSEVMCTAAASERTFAMDRAIDGVWREYVDGFFKDNKITVRRN